MRLNVRMFTLGIHRGRSIATEIRLPAPNGISHKHNFETDIPWIFHILHVFHLKISKGINPNICDSPFCNLLLLDQPHRFFTALQIGDLESHPS